MFGIPKKILYKKIKKDLGGVDFKIWEKYDIFNMDLMFYDYENDTFEDEKIIEVLNKSEFYKGSNRNDFRIPKRRRKSFEDELKSIFNVSLTDKSEAVAK
jgi:IMP cyclohydrolase